MGSSFRLRIGDSIMTKSELIAELKKKYKTLSYGVNDEVIEMSATEYEAQIEAWADAQIAKEQGLAESQAKRQALLDKLGITEAEAKILLG